MNAPVDLTNVRVETPRLLLRAWRPDDLDDLYAYARVDGVGQMAGWMPHDSRSESERILRRFIEGKHTFALVLPESGRVVGSLGLEEGRVFPASLPPSALGREIGYVLARDLWGQGLMPEAVRAVIRLCFSEWKWDYLTVGHFSWNDQSRRVIEKCGFHRIGEIEMATQCGTVEQVYKYCLTRADWQAAEPAAD